jgi:Lrp/AsnC family transcriptional regulator, leucine-responsive regulatory protein
MLAMNKANKLGRFQDINASYGERPPSAKPSIRTKRPDLVGRPITLIVQIAVEHEHTGLHEVIKKSFQDTPEVQQCYYVTGEFDFVVVMTVTNMAEYEAISQRLFLGADNIARFKTNVVMDRVKFQVAIPV